MSEIHFEVHAYSEDRLKTLLAKAADARPELVASKQQVAYLHQYLEDKKAKTILFESDYIDRDYLEDYAGYYVRCFNHKDEDAYGPRCHRMHYFTREFSEDEFRAMLSRSTSAMKHEELQATYLGFQVVKPLPEKFMGRTCLATYEPAERNRRHFPINHTYDVNLFGLKLQINSLPFQEQDSVVAACATSALWSAFHGTGKMFQHTIPSPLVITKAATDAAPISARVIPNSGLSVTMMTHAIRHIGLDPYPVYLLNDINFHLLKSTVYAYLEAGIPVIFGIELKERKKGLVTDTLTSMDFHAVTIAGYSMGADDPIPYKESNFLLKASCIEKIYVHDDQVGPFTKMEFKGNSIETQWMNDGVKGNVVAETELLLIPLYHKIRIPFITIHKLVNRFDQFIKKQMRNVPNGENVKIVWDIRLTTVGKFKSALLEMGLEKTSELTRVLTLKLPKYMWVATAEIGGTRQMDLLFDATNIEQGHVFIDAVRHSDYLDVTMRLLVKSQAFATTPEKDLAGIRPILECFKDT